MKWKIFQLSALLNLFSIAACIVFIFYTIIEKNATMPTAGVIVFAIAFIIFIARDVTGLRFVRSLHGDNSPILKFHSGYTVLSVLQTLATIATVIELVSHINEIRTFPYIDKSLVAWWMILLIFTVTSLYMTIIDFFLLPALKTNRSVADDLFSAEERR